MFSGESQFWNVLRRFDYWNLWVHVGTYSGRAGIFVRLFEDVLVVVGLLSG